MMLSKFFKQSNLALRHIDIKEFLSSLDKLKHSCIYNISNHLNYMPPKEKLYVILVSIERGGNIPTTIINYSLSEVFKEDIRNRLLSIHSLTCSLSTRDKKPGSNEEALEELKEALCLNHLDANSLLQQVKNLKVYIIDDLLDSGKTLRIIHRSLKREAWYKQVTYLFGFAKGDPKQIIKLISKYPQINIGKVLNTKAWLSFWYETK